VSRRASEDKICFFFILIFVYSVSLPAVVFSADSRWWRWRRRVSEEERSFVEKKNVYKNGYYVIIIIIIIIIITDAHPKSEVPAAAVYPRRVQHVSQLSRLVAVAIILCYILYYYDVVRLEIKERKSFPLF